MGVITQEMNKKRQLEVTAEGYVKFIKLTKFDEPKVTHWQGKVIESTHRASVLLEKDEDSQWINLGEFKSQRDNITFKVGDEWKELKQGQLVLIDIKKVGEYNGKPTYQSSKSSITILEEAPKQSEPQSNANPKPQAQSSQKHSNEPKQPQPESFKVYGEIKSLSEGVAVVANDKPKKDIQVILGEHAGEVAVGGVFTAQVDGEGNIIGGWKVYKTGKKEENVGMLRCHANNGATTLLQTEKQKMTFENLVEAAKVIHDVTTSVKEWFAATEAGSKMDERERGNTVGNAVLNSAYMVKRDKLEETVKEYLQQVVPAVSSYILNEKTEESQPQEQEDVSDYESNDEPCSYTPEEPSMDFDSDIPFAPIGLQYREVLMVM